MKNIHRLQPGDIYEAMVLGTRNGGHTSRNFILKSITHLIIDGDIVLLPLANSIYKHWGVSYKE